MLGISWKEGQNLERVGRKGNGGESKGRGEKRRSGDLIPVAGTVIELQSPKSVYYMVLINKD